MKTIRNSALAIALSLGVTGSALAAQDSENPWLDLPEVSPYAGADTAEVRSDHAVPGSHAADDVLGGYIQTVKVDIADFSTAASSEERPQGGADLEQLY